MKKLLLVAALLAGCGPTCDNKESGCAGFLEDTGVSNDGRFRYCKYTDGFILTIKYFEQCPLTD